MNFTTLEWDSNFFGLPIGKIEMDVHDTEADLRKELAKRNECELIYIFTPENYLLELPSHDSKCNLVDQKIVYEIAINPVVEIHELPSNHDVRIEDYTQLPVSEKIIDMALQSGEYSRYKLDPKFPKDAYEKLYKTWIVNSVNHSIADHVYLVLVKEVEAGIISIKSKNDKTTIGLFAVDEKYRGNSLGSRLTSHVIQQAVVSNQTAISVATQLANKQACRFYEKHNFKKDHVTNVYHYWQN